MKTIRRTLILFSKSYNVIASERKTKFTRDIDLTGDQEPNEYLDAFVTALRTLANTCNFGVLENSPIRDRIVIGVIDNQARNKLPLVS